MNNLKEIIAIALEEDLSKEGDITSSFIFDTNEKAEFNLFAKENGIICGCNLVVQVMHTIDKDILILEKPTLVTEN